MSIGDGQMRHGRNNKTPGFDGYKRHQAVDLDSGVIVALAVTPGNGAESETAEEVFEQVESQSCTVGELFIDRGYLTAEAVQQRRRAGLEVRRTALALRNEGRYTKKDFRFVFSNQTITCPAGHSRPMVLGRCTHFAASLCNACTHRERCTTSSTGRNVTVHPEEAFYSHLRQRQQSSENRAQLRQRVVVEHRLAHVGQTQGQRARYKGVRKNVFGLRRHAPVPNLYRMAAKLVDALGHLFGKQMIQNHYFSAQSLQIPLFPASRSKREFAQFEGVHVFGNCHSFPDSSRIN